MGLIAFLILFPFLAAFVLACMRKSGLVRKYTMFTFCVIIMAAVLVFSATSLISGETVSYLPETHLINTGTVSYTHLDVYKRQHASRAGFLSGSFRVEIYKLSGGRVSNT